MLARVFEPFFTTKPVGLGAGLGLPLCRGILEAHGGALQVTSRPGQGATFHLALPVTPLPEPTASPTADEPPTGHGARLLLVDDEPSILHALSRLLQRDGYTVETAANGREALERLQEGAYDGLLSDIRMPELDGPGLYRTLARQQPQMLQRMIFLTGDTLNAETQAFLQQSGVPCLRKPYTSAELRRLVRQMLRARG